MQYSGKQLRVFVGFCLCFVTHFSHPHVMPLMSVDYHFIVLVCIVADVFEFSY